MSSSRLSLNVLGCGGGEDELKVEAWRRSQQLLRIQPAGRADGARWREQILRLPQWT